MAFSVLPGGVLMPQVLGPYDYGRLRDDPISYVEALQDALAESFARRKTTALCAYLFARVVPELGKCPRDFDRADLVWFTGPEHVDHTTKRNFQILLRDMVQRMDVQMVMQASETWLVQAKPGTPEYAAYREWLRTHDNDCEGFPLAKEQLIVSVEMRWGERRFYENAIRRDVHGNPSLTRWDEKKGHRYTGDMMDVFAGVTGGRG